MRDYDVFLLRNCGARSTNKAPVLSISHKAFKFNPRLMELTLLPSLTKQLDNVMNTPVACNKCRKLYP